MSKSSGKRSEAQTTKLRELFIEELVEVQGGSEGPNLEDLYKQVRDKLMTTQGCCEEFPSGCC